MPSNRNLGRWSDDDLIPDAEKDARAAGLTHLREAGSGDLPPLSNAAAEGSLNYVGVLDWRQADAGPARLVTLVLGVYQSDLSPSQAQNLPEMKARITFGVAEGEPIEMHCDLIVGTVLVLPAKFIRVEVTKVKTFAGAEVFSTTPRATALIAHGQMPGARPQLTVLSQSAALAAGASVVVDIPTFAKTVQLTTDTPGNSYQIQQMNPSAALAYQDWTLGANQLCPEIPIVGLSRKVKITNRGLSATTHGPWLVFGLGI